MSGSGITIHKILIFELSIFKQFKNDNKGKSDGPTDWRTDRLTRWLIGRVARDIKKWYKNLLVKMWQDFVVIVIFFFCGKRKRLRVLSLRHFYVWFFSRCAFFFMTWSSLMCVTNLMASEFTWILKWTQFLKKWKLLFATQVIFLRIRSWILRCFTHCER